MESKIKKIWHKIKKQAIKDYDAILGVSYQVYVINTTSNVELFLWHNWQELMPNIDLILNLTQKDAFIRTSQSFEDKNKWLGFGRMKWNETNNKKWTTKYRLDNISDIKLKFFDTEIWAPDWNSCLKAGESPEVFIHVYHYPTYPKLNEGILLAIQNRIVKNNEYQLEEYLNRLAKKIHGSTFSSIKRYWQPSNGFLNRIEDMNPQELERIVFSKI